VHNSKSRESPSVAAPSYSLRPPQHQGSGAGRQYEQDRGADFRQAPRRALAGSGAGRKPYLMTELISPDANEFVRDLTSTGKGNGVVKEVDEGRRSFVEEHVLTKERHWREFVLGAGPYDDVQTKDWRSRPDSNRRSRP
jgi:hypothetical protein